ncbi:hypothetical protein AVEN_71728-1 [Araneus ventricosus]|uniref:Uncharacterized protein n=1 Tax=Araneus ventricosus TaxID=182803 RepID=A0A4Y2ER08_ARAVE|nr:hypothetical protein AVEN_71728-1 [Araneus ventricosus]
MPLQFHERKVPIKQFSSREVRAEVGVAGKCQLLFNSSTSSDGWRAMSSGTLYGMTHAKAMKTSGPRRHSPPKSPTRKGSYQLWELPASALTMGLSGIYTFRVTYRNVDQP